MKSKYDNFLKQDRFRELLGVEVIEIRDYYAKVKGVVKKEHLNFYNVCHGAFITALTDFAFAIAGNTDGKKRMAIYIKTEFYKPVFEGDELIAEAKRITGNKIAFFEVRVHREDELVARGEGIGYRMD